jgi:hypothetical protein
MSFGQALQMIERNGGKIDGENVTIKCQQPVAVRYEKGFDGLYPIERRGIHKKIADINFIAFEGTGIVVTGYTSSPDKNYAGKMEAYINGELVETINLPVNHTTRRYELFWKYMLPKAEYTLTFKWLNPQPDATIHFREAIVYSDAPLPIEHK